MNWQTIAIMTGTDTHLIIFSCATKHGPLHVFSLETLSVLVFWRISKVPVGLRSTSALGKPAEGLRAVETRVRGSYRV